MALPKAITCTLEDIYALPDGERAELINGHIYNMLRQAASIRKF